MSRGDSLRFPGRFTGLRDSHVSLLNFISSNNSKKIVKNCNGLLDHLPDYPLRARSDRLEILVALQDGELGVPDLDRVEHGG